VIELHRTRIKRTNPPDPIFGRAGAWSASCTCGSRYLTDDGWADAMIWSLAHRSFDPEGERQYQSPHVGWWPWTAGVTT
jgi:hypothetical protein